LLYQKLNNKTIKKTKMKKVIAIFAIATTMVACGGKGTNEATTDSTAVAVDSTVVTTTDSVATDSAAVVK
jgi:ABC-type glycerol-3-phosphate transport system substrate-binding protein